MGELNIIERHAGEVVILDLKGDLTFGNGNNALCDAMSALLGHGKKNLLLNMEETRFLDSSGIGVLVLGYTAANRENGRLKLMKPSQRVREILAITKLLSIFDIFEREADALQSYN